MPWEVRSVRVLRDYRLFVRFVDGTEGEVDLTPFLFEGDAGVFKHLRDPLEFAKAYVRQGVVTWPGDLDLAPDAMYEDIRSGQKR